MENRIGYYGEAEPHFHEMFLFLATQQSKRLVILEGCTLE